MVTIILFILIALICAFFIMKWAIDEEAIFEGIGLVLIVWIGLFFLSLIPMHFEGLYRGYGMGERTGYITKLSEKGIFWKTIEGQIQVGTGNMSALQEPFDFTIRKLRPDLIALADSLGTTSSRVKIHYVQWLVMPCYVGDSGYEVDDIEVLE